MNVKICLIKRTYSDDVCVLSASGTAAVVSLHFADLGDTVFNLPTNQKPPKEMASSFDEKDKATEKSEIVLVRRCF